MSGHLSKEVERLKQRLFSLCTLVEESLKKAIKCIQEGDENLAAEVAKSDAAIDEIEIQVEEECLKILALHQPVASDLRYIIAILKMNNDLERIGDLAVNIVQSSQAFIEDHELKEIFQFQELFKVVLSMLKNSLDALINQDAEVARQVCLQDDQVDKMHSENFTRVKKEILDNPKKLEGYLRGLSVSRYLERIADHSTNIAEDVIYFEEGDIVRHHHSLYLG